MCSASVYLQLPFSPSPCLLLIHILLVHGTLHVPFHLRTFQGEFPLFEIIFTFSCHVPRSFLHLTLSRRHLDLSPSIPNHSDILVGYFSPTLAYTLCLLLQSQYLFKLNFCLSTRLFTRQRLSLVLCCISDTGMSPIDDLFGKASKYVQGFTLVIIHSTVSQWAQVSKTRSGCPHINPQHLKKARLYPEFIDPKPPKCSIHIFLKRFCFKFFMAQF